MQLGTRWTAGGEPPRALSAEFISVLRAVEAELPPGAPLPRWTLTWLEGRPVAELDTGVIVSVDAGGNVVARHDADDDFA